MPNNYAIPGVYVEEIPKFPPSVAQVETAIPAFIGYTEKALDASGNDLSPRNTPVRITSFTEFETRFGNAPTLSVAQVRIDANDNFIGADISTSYYLHHAVQLFYANGGGDCYIVSVDEYQTGSPFVEPTPFTDGLGMISQVDEPTILLFPDIVRGADADSPAVLTDVQVGDIQKAALAQCADLQDRVTICDLRNADPATTADIGTFRQNIGINNLKYGAAYTPWLQALLPKNVSYAQLNGSIFVRAGATATDLMSLNTDPPNPNPEIANELNNYDLILAAEPHVSTGTLRSDASADYQTLVQETDMDNITTDLVTTINLIDAEVTSNLVPVPFATLPADYTAAYTALIQAINDYEALSNPPGDTLGDIAEGLEAVISAYNNYLNFVGPGAIANAEASLRSVYPLYRTIIAGINSVPLSVPPSGAIAGVYAAVDRTRGVWKAPANVSLTSVVGPTKAYDQSTLGNLNIDPSTGKSINAIRSFTGKGTLVWGARTLAGNDNEWRYVSVRRFFNMVEESVKKAAEQFVFEPNDANTWVRVQAMIENFLTLQWRDGALQGAKQEQAFRVAVGLGKTMTSQDILDGRMIVQIALAPVRPAEFIILRFEQMMAQS